jgi:hypothetical protein
LEAAEIEAEEAVVWHGGDPITDVSLATINGIVYKSITISFIGAALTTFSTSFTRKRMGRPALHMTPTVIRLLKSTAERIDAIVGKKRRAEFIRMAIEKELASQEKQRPKEPSP